MWRLLWLRSTVSRVLPLQEPPLCRRLWLWSTVSRVLPLQEPPLCRRLWLRSTVSRVLPLQELWLLGSESSGSVAVAHGLSCSAA